MSIQNDISIDEAIQYMEALVSNNPMFPPMKEAAKIAIDALHEKQEAEKNDPITKEEIEKMNGEPIFFVPLKNKDAIPGWSIIRGDSITSRSEAKPALMYFFYLKNYGTDWIAYRHKKGPSHE